MPFPIDADPVPPYASLLLRFIRLNDQYVPLGVVKSLNIVGDKTRATMNMETMKGKIYVSDWSLEEQDTPMYKAHGYYWFPMNDAGSDSIALGPQQPMPIWTEDENTGGYYQYGFDNAIVIPDDAIYRVGINAEFSFTDEIDCWCHGGGALIDKTGVADASFAVDNGVLGPNWNGSTHDGWVYYGCAAGGARLAGTTSSRGVGRIKAGKEIKFGFGFVAVMDTANDDCRTKAQYILTMSYNLSIVKIRNS